jgi:hypothetical protein
VTNGSGSGRPKNGTLFLILHFQARDALPGDEHGDLDHLVLRLQPGDLRGQPQEALRGSNVRTNQTSVPDP